MNRKMNLHMRIPASRRGGDFCFTWYCSQLLPPSTWIGWCSSPTPAFFVCANAAQRLEVANAGQGFVLALADAGALSWQQLAADWDLSIYIYKFIKKEQHLFLIDSKFTPVKRLLSWTIRVCPVPIVWRVGIFGEIPRCWHICRPWDHQPRGSGCAGHELGDSFHLASIFLRNPEDMETGINGTEFFYFSEEYNLRMLRVQSWMSTNLDRSTKEQLQQFQQDLRKIVQFSFSHKICCQKSWTWMSFPSKVVLFSWFRRPKTIL